MGEAPVLTATAPVYLAVAGVTVHIGDIDIPVTFRRAPSDRPSVLELVARPDPCGMRESLAGLLRESADALAAAR